MLFRSLMGGAPSRAKIAAFLSEHPDLATDPLDVIVKSGDQRKMPGIKNHVRSKELPDRSFYKLDDELYVASPELCLAQLSVKLSEPEIVKLAYEMCGNYAIDPFADPYDKEAEGFGKRPALTNKKQLIAYIERLYSPGTRARGHHFLRYIADASASPRETALCMLLCMPPYLGGYGIAIPVMNKRITLSFSEQLMVGIHHFDCDLYWPDKRVAVEYDCARYHTAVEKQECDAIRRNMLQYKGLKVITATRKQVSDPAQFDKLAHQIARAVGKRLRIPEKEHIAARSQLRETLFNWDLLSGE